jgi:cytochrome-b5 reductase
MEGKFEMLIKVYFKDTHPQFPEGGKMSQYLNSIPFGDNIKVRGPFGKLSYFGDGYFKILTKFKPATYKEKKYKYVGMLAGGTGITPFYQVIKIKFDSIRFYKQHISTKILLNSDLYLEIKQLRIFY